MRFAIDLIVAALFWSFTIFSTVEVYQFFRNGAIANIERGLSSTEKFTETLIQK